MTNLLIGIGLGGFLYFAGERFLKFAIKALKERKENETKKAEETMAKIVGELINAREKGE